MSRTTIESITVESLNIPLLEPFTIATGSVSAASNVLITIRLQDGSVGYGECAPFPPSTGESQETALAAARACAALLKGRDAAHWRVLSHLLHSVYYAQTTVIAGMEMAKETVERGITTIKIKVGGDVRDDVARVEAIRSGAPGLGLTLDANQGYTPNEALLCLEALDDRDIRPLMLEQPVHKDDYEGLRYVTQHTTVPVAADESASSAAAVARLLAMGAVNVVNIKLMKTGIVQSLDIAALCHATHTPLMIGAMIESRLASSAAAHFAAGLGGFRYIDLDTPMLLTEDPFTGGYEQREGIYDLSGIEAGLGIEKR
jgi:L-alanine-DL-glutamate epimerase-like enolase superfamily enzyme